METWRERLSARLRHLKATDGMTQQKLADQLGVAQSTVAGWLHGRREPETLKQFEDLAAAIQVPPSWLLFGEEESAEDYALRQLLKQLNEEHRSIVRNLASTLVSA